MKQEQSLEKLLELIITPVTRPKEERMTIEKFEAVREMIAERQGKLNSVWRYKNKLNQQFMFAMFLTAAECDIYSSSYVEAPELIWAQGKFLGTWERYNDGI